MRKHSYRRLRKSPIVIERVYLINKIVKELLSETFNSLIETEYKIVVDGDIIIYRFKTNSDNFYDLEFIINQINCNNKIDSGGVLSDYTESYNIRGYCLIPTIDIGFVPSEINLDDRDNHELYTKETNRGEQFELMGRISYLVKEYIKNNPEEKVFVVGKNTKETKLKMYEKMFTNLFNNDFLSVEGENFGYDNGCFYFIKK
jgi:hypothetical protein